MSAIRRVLLALNLAASLVVTAAHAQTVRGDLPITNGQVNAQVIVGRTLYLGGTFSFVGPVTGSGVPVDAVTGVAVSGFPRVDGQITVALPDGTGGWFLGGTFTKVGSESRTNLAHILADDSIDSWAPQPNGQVRTLLISGDTLLVGGDFTSIATQARNRIAALSVSSGAAMAWNPNANGSVRTLLRSGSSLYVGGTFTNIGGQNRNRLAEVSVPSGLATGWNPNANSPVLALALAHDTLYAAGQFTAIAGVTRNRIAAVSTSSASAFAWNPNANNQVLALALRGNTVYVGGLFTSIGGQTRNRIAALPVDASTATGWNPNANSTVQALHVQADTVFAGGDFTTIAGQSRSRIAALSAVDASALAWNPAAFGSVSALSYEGGQLLVGGTFNAVGGLRRNNLAAFDLDSGQVTSWDPSPNNQVFALLATSDALLAGGAFTLAGGRIRNGLAAIDYTNGLATEWDPNASGLVSALSLTDSTLYVGGQFSSIGGQTRANLAALRLGTGLATAWDPGADAQVLTLEPNGTTVYVGGSFTTIGGSARDFLAAIDANTGLATAWNPSPSGTVRTIIASCDRVLVGGFFTIISGVGRNQLASLHPTTAVADGWNPDPNGPVFSLTRGPGVVYAGGIFSQVGGQTRNRLAALSPSTGLASSWNPNVNGTVRNVLLDGSALYAGGTFTTVGTSPSGNFAGMSADSSLPCATISLPASPVPTATSGTPFSFAASASGGVSPYCYSIRAGSLPSGLTLTRDTGLISGTPTQAGVSICTIQAMDHHGCFGTTTYTFTVLGAPIASNVAPTTVGECLTPSQPCLRVPFVLTRGESSPLRAVSVTFQIDAAKLALCAPGPATASILPGSWLNAFPNSHFEVTSPSAGVYTVDQVVFGNPCGVTTGGELFTVDLQSMGIDGAAAISVLAVTARDCSNAPVGVSPGAAATLNILGTPITVLPAALSAGTAGSGYSQTLTTSAGTAPLSYAVTAGSLPPGITLAPSGLLSGTCSGAGTFGFTVTATDAGGCRGSRAYSLTVSCPTITLSPSLLPDGAVGVAYAQSFSAAPGLTPRTYSVTAGALPAGLTLSTAGALSGTPTIPGNAVFTITVTDAAGCTASADHVVGIFATPPVSSVAANTTALCISSAHPCVSVPVDYTRDETAPLRALSITFQLEPARLALCTPADPATSVHAGPMFTSQPNHSLQVTDLGGGAYRADLTLLGAPCGITTAGTALTLDVTSVGSDGSGTITITAVRSRDCDNGPVPVLAGPQAALRILNTPITILPPTLPNAIAGDAYSQALNTDSGLAPFTYVITAGALPAGLTLSPAGVLSGTPVVTGTFGFTVSVADQGDAPGSRNYNLTVSCAAMAIAPLTLPPGAVGVPYSEVFTASAGAAPIGWSVSAGSLPSGLSLSPTTGELSGTPTVASTGVFTVTATDAAGCTVSEPYTLAVFADPAISMVSASTAGLCLSAAHACVSVPFGFARGETAPARGLSVTFQLETTRLALCTPATPAASVHFGSWLAGYANRTLQVVDLGAGTYRVDLALLGAPCGPTTGGELFTVDVQSVGPDGPGTITVTAVQVRDCANVPLPGVPGPIASLTVNHATPTALTDLASAQLLTGNTPGSTTGVQLTWSLPAPGTVSVYRAPFGSYPRFDEPGPVTPPSAATAPSSPWVLVSANAASGLVDHPPTRGFWHYAAFLTDSCGNRSLVSNQTSGALNYHLGDVSDGVTQAVGDNRVDVLDISLLGAHYGISGAAILMAGLSYLDVGPTTDGMVTSRPTTDQALDFEDLMVFSNNYQVVSAPQFRGAPIAKGTTGVSERFELQAPSLVEPGTEVVARLQMNASGHARGFSARLDWDASVVEPIEMTSRQFVETQGGIVLSPRPGVLDAALLNRSGGLSGAGELASWRFRVLRQGDAAIHLSEVDVRDADNRRLAPDAIDHATLAAPPTRTLLLAPWPNPAPQATTVAFALAEAGPAEVAIFSVDGRRVRTLANGPRAAGMYRVTWAGDDDTHHTAAPGVYFVRLTTATRESTRRLVLLR